ncbi:MAG TPA: DnaJ domain-containing protein [Desertimonas sp.]|nr:DnaJ domain-containing protein [Desertimonas sp.]
MVSLDDARRLLGVSPDAGVEDVRAARRRLAKRCHPDVAGGDTETMRQLNEAASIVLHELGVVSEDTESPIDAAAWRRWPAPRRPPTGARVDHDVASFVIEALPAVAFEALLVVTSWIGEVVVDEPPYQLDVLLLDPLRCWCRLDLVPDAGASTVSLTIAALPDEALPDIDDVRDLWVESLNRLGR